jgi:hypothetical protein
VRYLTQAPIPGVLALDLLFQLLYSEFRRDDRAFPVACEMIAAFALGCTLGAAVDFWKAMISAAGALELAHVETIDRQFFDRQSVASFVSRHGSTRASTRPGRCGSGPRSKIARATPRPQLSKRSPFPRA